MDDQQKIRDAVGEEHPDSTRITPIKRVPRGALTFAVVMLAVVIGGIIGLQSWINNIKITEQNSQLTWLTANAAETQERNEFKTAVAVETQQIAVLTVNAEQTSTAKILAHETNISSTEHALATKKVLTEIVQRTASVISKTIAVQETQISLNMQRATQKAELKNYPIIKFGRYEQDNNLTNGAEEIEWLVLSQEGDIALVTSVMGLDAKPFHDPGGRITWKDSTLRAWLNNEFYNTAFNNSEREKIELNQIQNEDTTTMETTNIYYTYDNVFLLSTSEIETYFIDLKDRLIKPTKYAEAKGLWPHGFLGSVWWWSRTTMYGGALGIESAGFTKNFSGQVGEDTSDMHSVRPALRLNLGK